ncbi:MAG: VOC family protein [Gammaproteobacteria bacterium]|nr:VOC family protein [Gammaproteobacteria bacterium]
MIDHTGIIVSNLKTSINWYEAALASIGYGKLMEFSKEITQTTGVAGFGETKTHKPDFWLSEATQSKPVNTPRQHIAFRAENRKQVDEFYQAAIKAGGTDNGAPGPRPHYHANYYGAFVLDLDGHNIEVVCHKS